MKEDFLNAPSVEKWTNIANDFEMYWNFPNCIGAVDGKHVNIHAPACSWSMYYIYKKLSILLAVYDARYRFTLVNIGEAGRRSDSGVYGTSGIGSNIRRQIEFSKT